MSWAPITIGKALTKKVDLHVPDVSHDDLIWLAGWWEGEGCFTTSAHRTPVMQAVTTDFDTAERVANLFSVRPIFRSNDKKLDHHKDQWTVTLTGHRCRVWMLRLLPLMGKRRKARIIELLKSCEPTMVVAAVQAASGITGEQQVQ